MGNNRKHWVCNYCRQRKEKKRNNQSNNNNNLSYSYLICIHFPLLSCELIILLLIEKGVLLKNGLFIMYIIFMILCSWGKHAKVISLITFLVLVIPGEKSVSFLLIVNQWWSREVFTDSDVCVEQVVILCLLSMFPFCLTINNNTQDLLIGNFFDEQEEKRASL